jgi:hypothetical protein
VVEAMKALDIRHVPGDKALYVRDRRTAGWLEGTPFWVIVMGVLLVISLVIFALFRAKWLSNRR